MAIKLIVGLRNPGSAYEATRHNAGAWFVEQLAQQYRFMFKTEKKFQAELASSKIENQDCKIILPLTFMNLSGTPTRELSQFYRFAPEEILVVHDELDLPVGCTKLKTGGGHGGHNGLRDIISHLGNQNFHRLRIGIGHPGHKDLVHQYVLTKPSQADKQAIEEGISKALQVMPILVTGNMAEAMNQLHR